jgi:hypothetical protein
MPPLDLTSYIQLGKNSIKIAQIGPAEGFWFLLTVTRPEETDNKTDVNHANLQALFRR